MKTKKTLLTFLLFVSALLLNACSLFNESDREEEFYEPMIWSFIEGYEPSSVEILDILNDNYIVFIGDDPTENDKDPLIWILKLDDDKYSYVLFEDRHDIDISTFRKNLDNYKLENIDDLNTRSVEIKGDKIYFTDLSGAKKTTKIGKIYLFENINVDNNYYYNIEFGKTQGEHFQQKFSVSNVRKTLND